MIEHFIVITTQIRKKGVQVAQGAKAELKTTSLDFSIQPSIDEAALDNITQVPLPTKRKLFNFYPDYLEKGLSFKNCPPTNSNH